MSPTNSGDVHHEHRTIDTIAGESFDAADRNVLRCAYRHLAVASWRLAQSTGLREGQPGRYAAASARFRSLAEQSWPNAPNVLSTEPYVSTSSGRVTLTDLFAVALRKLGQPSLPRCVDLELVHEAEELLKGLNWHVPELA